MTRQFCEKAYILHTRPYRETSLLITAFFKNFGKISLISKGARSLRSDRKALLQPFVPLLISFQGKSDLKLLTNCEIDGAHLNLTQELLYCGLYLNELLYHLLPIEFACVDIFSSYETALKNLKQDYTVALRLFEKQFLQDLGYGLLLEHTAENEPVNSDALYRYVFRKGPEPVSLQLAGPDIISGKALLDFAKNDLSDPNSLLQIRQMMRKIMDDLMEGRVIKTRDLW